MLNYSPEKKKEFLDAAVKILSGDSANSADRALICHGLAAMSAESQGLDFQEIGDHLYDGVYIADGSGMTLYVNKSYERITGLKAEEVVGRYVQDLLDEGVYSNAVTPEVLRLKKRVDSVGQSTRNGARMLITGNPIFDRNGNIKLVAVIEREITDIETMLVELEATRNKIRSVEASKTPIHQPGRESSRKRHVSSKLIGDSRQIHEILALVRRIAEFDVTVLIQGETGVGKEIVATEIHECSLRKDKPFIRINCAAIPANLLESELFGYEKGAYTGAATSGKAGLFELANKGTILLDEIGDMPLELQGKLRRILQQKELTRVGGTRSVPLDVRVIAATNCNLSTLIQAGKFRNDLYFRLNVLPITVPPLRSRPEDIIALAEYFLAHYNSKYSKKVNIGRDGLTLFTTLSWPGNVRELQNIVERLVLISEPSSELDLNDLLPILRLEQCVTSLLPAAATTAKGLKEVVADFERSIIEQALREHGSTRKAATALGVDQSTIVKKAKRLGVDCR